MTIVAPKGSEPMTLEQLLALFDVDLNIWKVESFIVNSWPIGVKVEDKDITFTDGVMDGYVKSDGSINTERLYQAKAKLIRRVLTPSEIPIHHINLKIRKTRVKKPKTEKLKMALILPDPQFGFLKKINQSGAIPLHDRLSIDAVRNVAMDIKPNVVVWAGDILDLSEWSLNYLKKPEFVMTTQAALIEASWSIASLKNDLPWAEHVVMIGNHDDRLERFLIKKMSQVYQLRPADQLDLSSLLAIDNLLGLSRMDIHYVGNYPDGEWWINKYFKVVHGSVVRSRPGGTASAIIQGQTVNLAFGHIHRQEIVSERILGQKEDRPIWAASPGCLCHIDGRVPGSTKDRNWQKGAMVVQYDNNGFVGFPEFIRFNNDGAIFRGNVYTGQDKFEDLVSSTNGSFDWDAYKPVDFLSA